MKHRSFPLTALCLLFVSVLSACQQLFPFQLEDPEEPALPIRYARRNK